MPERESVTWGHAKRGEHCLQTFEKKGIKFLGGGNCNQGLWNPNWQDMDLQSFVLKKDGGYFQVYIGLTLIRIFPGHEPNRTTGKLIH